MPAQLRIIGRMVGRDSQLQPRNRRLRWASGEIYTEHYGCCLKLKSYKSSNKTGKYGM